MAKETCVVPADVFSVMSELLFQLHGGLLVESRTKLSPRSTRVIAGLLARLGEEETLPEDFRGVCECLRQDWRDCGKPTVHEYRLEMSPCAM